MPAKTYFPWEEAPVFAFEWEPGTLSEACLPDGSTVRLEICGREAPGLAESGRELADSKQKGYKNLLYLTLDYDKIEGNILIRQRLPGDRISLAGGNGTKKLKKLFNEKKLTAYEKSLLPVLADREGVVGILGVGADRRCLPGPGTTRLLVVRMEKPE